LIKLIKVEKPKLPILIFSMHPEEQYAVRAIKAGASGYLSKESDSDLLLPALRKILLGSLFISPKVAQLLAADLAPHNKTDQAHLKLSDREFEIFSRIVKGQSLTEIANQLSLSIKTVSTHKTHILEKMGLKNQVDLVYYAIDHNLLNQ
jgi:DNA-binding NarL/FixJ family response regulator